MTIKSQYDTINSGYKSRITFDLEFRRQQLRNLYYAIIDNEGLLTSALFKDLHRPPAETEMLELHLIVTEILTAIQNIDKWAKDENVDADIRFAVGPNKLVKEPYGLVLVIGPWNYPLLCTIGPVISAIAAGNTVMVKPTDVAVNSAKAITFVLENSLDKSVCQVVNGGVDETTEVLKLKFDKIMFTGSNRVGQIVAQAAANQKIPTPVVLELGGKSPAIIFKDANLKVAAKRLAWAKFANAGQTCIAPDYCIIDKSIANEFTKEVQNAITNMYPELVNGKESKDFAHIVSDKMFSRFEKMVKETKGEIWSLGQPNSSSRFFPPTLVRNVNLKDAVMQEELFGPILPFIETDDVLETVDELVVGEHDYPLASYIFSNSKENINAVLRNVRTGAVMVNDALQQGGSAGIPFGGVGASGMGRYHGKYGFDEFTHEKPVIYQPSFMEKVLNSRYPPFNKRKTFMVKAVSRPCGWWLPRTGSVKGTGYYLQQVLSTATSLLLSRWNVVLLVLYIVGYLK